MKLLISTIALAAVFGSTAAAQSNTAAPLQVQQATPQSSIVMPANTEVLLSMNQEVTTRGRTWNEGDTFSLSVVHDVIFDGFVVIPRGSRATGRITWMTDKGAFGKSGKMDIELQYVEVGGQRIDVDGTYRQEGEGNTVATVGGVILAGPFAAFITGKSGLIPQGRELMAHTEQDIPLALPANAVARPVNAGLAVTAVNGAQPEAAQQPAPTTATLNEGSAVRCETC